MKKLIRIVSVSLTLLMLLSALGTLPSFAEGEEKKPTVDDYATGLVTWYNGEQNKRSGHDEASTVWEDLAGNNNMTVATNANNYFTAEGFHLDSTQHNFPQAIVDLVNGQEFTVEMTLGDLVSKGTDFNTFINSKNDAFSLYRRISGDALEFKFASNTSAERPKTSGALELFANSTVAVTYKVGGVTIVYVDGIKIGEMPSPKVMGADNLYFGHASASKNYETTFRSMRFYNRVLTADEIWNNAKADGVIAEDIADLPRNPGFVSIEQPKTNIIGDVALVRSVESQKELDEVVADETKPSTIIVKIDKDLNVLDANGAKFTTVQDLLIKLEYKAMVAFNISDNASADALVSYLKRIKFYDCFIMSADPATVKYARTALPEARGIIDYTEKYKESKGLTYDECVEIRRSMKANLGTIALLPVAAARKNAVQSLYNMIVNVWVRTTDNADQVEKYDALLSGALGVVSDDTSGIYEAASKLDPKTLTRIPLNIGHRGMPDGYPENTVEGSLAAYNAGANVIEIDIYLTTDGDIAVMHDANTGRTCNVDLVVENSTMAQLKELYVNRGFENTSGKNNYRVPSFRDYLEAFKGKDCKLFVEIKSTKEAIVPEIKKQIEEYDMYDQCAIITFHESQMANVKKYFPEMSVGALCSGYVDETNSDEDMKSVMSFIGKYNSTLNPSYSGYGVNAIRAALLRGIGVYPWTFVGGNYHEYLMNGYSGLTGNTAYTLSRMVTEMKITNLENGSTFEVGDKIAIKGEMISYDRSNARINGGLKHMIIDGEDLVESDGKYITFKGEGEVSLLVYCTNTVTPSNYTIYTQPITIHVEDAETTTTTATTDETEIPTEIPTETTTDNTTESDAGGEDDVVSATGCKSSVGVIALSCMSLFAVAFVAGKKKEK